MMTTSLFTGERGRGVLGSSAELVRGPLVLSPRVVA
jgi:hypothetical protein